MILNSQQTKKREEWYIPHHPVVNAAKNTRVRIVFDCAAKYEGVALNEKVLQGPDLINGLLGILLRFRQHPVALTADVEAMFLQVKVPPGDRDVLHFLWWAEGDITANLQIYLMSSHLFGGTWSPSVCSYALQRTAKDNARDFHPEVGESVLRDSTSMISWNPWKKKVTLWRWLTCYQNSWREVDSAYASG